MFLDETARDLAKFLRHLRSLRLEAFQLCEDVNERLPADRVFRLKRDDAVAGAVAEPSSSAMRPPLTVAAALVESRARTMSVGLEVEAAGAGDEAGDDAHHHFSFADYQEPGRTNDPEATMANILEVATTEFAEKGLAGARIGTVLGYSYRSLDPLFADGRAKRDDASNERAVQVFATGLALDQIGQLLGERVFFARGHMGAQAAVGELVANAANSESAEGDTGQDSRRLHREHDPVIGRRV